MAISVVTCCMNRNDHLARTIAQWLNREEVKEVVVVDWSSAVPVAETLRDMCKDKVRIVRAEGEDHWILAYAYNLGITHASGDLVLKIDADCFVGTDFFAAGRPDDSVFYAGNSIAGTQKGKGGSVNGQCFLTRRAFEAVNGFNELIRSWGFDDHDFYRRLEGRGLRRLEIDCDLLDFIGHSDEARTSNTARPKNPRPAQDLLERQIWVQEMRNAVVAEQMPWGPWFPRARYRRMWTEGPVTHVERMRQLEIPIPNAVMDFAQLEAGRMALRIMRIDNGRLDKTDYPTIIGLFERWIDKNPDMLRVFA